MRSSDKDPFGFESDVEASSRSKDDNVYEGDATDVGSHFEEASRRVKPWMKFHDFTLVKSADRLREIVDKAIAVGRVALDLETEGLDNRIDYDGDTPRTKHQIVGYCLGLEGAGYYVPVRHDTGSKYDTNLNVDSVVRAEAEITRLCRAAQPVLKPGADILGAREKDFQVPPSVVIEFWHAKFDQEFLYPLTGIDLWNPRSFEDGMLMAYVLYTDDDHRLKQNAFAKLPLADGKHPYEMIEFKDLFLPGMKKKDRRIKTLTPREGSDVVYYGCSDGICTNLLCALLLPKVDANRRFKMFYRLEKQVSQSVRIVERPRVLINKKEIDVLLAEAETELATYEGKIKKTASDLGFGDNFNPASAAQLADLLFSSKGLNLQPKPEKTAEGQYRTDEKTIDKYVEKHETNHPQLNWIVKHRQINKVRGTYLKNLSENTDKLDQLRLNFKQTGAATGRFTAPAGDPKQGYGGIPIQGIPARDDPKKPKVAHSLRRLFISRPGYKFVKVDYASQELRIAASVSGEEKWIKEYEREVQTGEPADLHFMTAQAFFPGLTKDSPDLKLKRNSGKCVHPDTLVLTREGLRPVGSLGDFGRPDTFVDAPEGLTVDGQPVVALFNGGIKELVHVVAARGALTCTLDHRFKTDAGFLVRARDLVPGMCLENIVADGTQPIEKHWRKLSVAGPYMARHHHQDGAPAQIVSVRWGMVQIAPCSRETPNEVLEVLPAGLLPCLDITLGTDEHLYRANRLLTHNTANFSLVYGGGVGAVQRATGCDEVEGARLKKAFDESVPQFSKWVKRQHTLVKAHLGVETAFHRFIAIPDAKITGEEINRRRKDAGKDELEKIVAAKEAKKIQAACERKASNFPIQGCIRSVSLVQTFLGQKCIGDLARAGDPVDVWTGSRWALATAHDMGPCELAEIDLSDGTLIECDTRHKLLIVCNEGYRWVEYVDLTAGMAVATSLCEPLEFGPVDSLPDVGYRKRSRLNFIAPSKENELWYWIGRYMGDGCLDSRKSGVAFCFGDHERDAIDRCKAFWTEAGLNPVEEVATHRPHTKISTRFRVNVWSVDLYDWLVALGLPEGVTAHTKRCPQRIFEETIEHRRAFLRGVMESDGHKPSLPDKVDGVWDPKRKGNPYNVHLCQRPLLVDLKRLFRTVGVESVIRGPYKSGLDARGEDTTSYRLDIQRRMFELNVMGNEEACLPKFHDMDAPRFLVEELLSAGPFPRSAFGGNESAYTLFGRLKAGGRVTVYTLRFLCRLLGVETSVPIYGFRRLVEKRALGREEHTYTLNVRDPLHRFESDGVITKNSGADILKISLVLLTREFMIRGWLKSGGDDSVRMVMTVHDEIVFEIREERIAEAVPIIVAIMESPYKLAQWRVPLIAEPTVGDSWDADVGWQKMLQGKVERPSYLQGVEIATHPDVFVLRPDTSPKEAVVSKALPPVQAPAQRPPGAATAPVTPKPNGTAHKPNGALPRTAPVVLSLVPSSGKQATRYLSIKLNTTYVDPPTVCNIVRACTDAKIEAFKLGKIEEMVPVEFLLGTGHLLYSRKQGYKVYADELLNNLRRLNLLESHDMKDGYD